MTRKLLATLSLAAATSLAACVPGGPDGGLNASADPRARMGAQQAGRSGAAPAAMLEAIADAQSAEFDAFDYLDAGQSIALGARGRATIAYFESCRVEQIRGGTVTVGNAESRVAGGQVNARTMACKGTKPVVVDGDRDIDVNRAGTAVPHLAEGEPEHLGDPVPFEDRPAPLDRGPEGIELVLALESRRWRGVTHAHTVLRGDRQHGHAFVKCREDARQQVG